MSSTEQLSECVNCGATVTSEEIVTGESREDGRVYVDEIGCVRCIPEPMDAETIGCIRFHEAQDEPELFGGRF